MVTAQDVFDFMESVFNKEEALKLKQDIVITYNIAGLGGGTWQLIMKNGEHEFQPGNGVSPVTAIVNYKDVESFYKLTTGEMSGIRGYASGAIKYDGSAKLLVSVGKVFSYKSVKKNSKSKKRKKSWRRH